jgi:hypothetical protein
MHQLPPAAAFPLPSTPYSPPLHTQRRNIIFMLLDVLSTPSEAVQRAVSNCLPRLVQPLAADKEFIQVCGAGGGAYGGLCSGGCAASAARSWEPVLVLPVLAHIHTQWLSAYTSMPAALVHEHAHVPPPPKKTP